MRIRILSVVLAAALLPVPHVSVWSQAGNSETSRAIRSQTQLVLVSVTVRDSKGTPVRDLRADDFTLTDEGRVQKVSFFTSPASTEVERRGLTEPLPANTFTNRPRVNNASSTRVSVILFDALNTPLPEQPRALEQLVSVVRQLQPGDRVALYALGNNLRILHEFTSDAESLVNAFKNYSGETAARRDDKQALIATGYGPLDVFVNEVDSRAKEASTMYRTRTTLSALEAIARRMAGISGRKNLIWLTGAFPLQIGAASDDDILSEGERLAIMDKQSEGTAPRPIVTPHSQTRERRDMTKEIEQLAQVMNQNDVAVFPVDTRGLVVAPLPELGMEIGTPTGGGGGGGVKGGSGGSSRQGSQGGQGGQSGQGGQNNSNTQLGSAGSPRPTGPGLAVGGKGVPPNPAMFDLRNSQAAMAEVAVATGGKAFYNTNAIGRSIRTVLDEPAESYLLGFTPDHNKWDDKFHRLSVKVGRSGLRVQHRRGYVAAAEKRDAKKIRDQALRDGIASPLDATAIGITVQLTARGKSEAEATVMLDTKSLSLLLEGDRYAGAVGLAYVQMDSQGRVVGQMQQTVKLHLKPDDYQKILEGDLTVVKRVPLAVGATLLRIVALDETTGGMGSVSIPVKTSVGAGN